MQKKEHKESTDSLTGDSNCKCQQRMFSHEMAEWLRLHRKHWYEDSEIMWSRPKQFQFTFLGSLSFFIAIHIFISTTRTVPSYELIADLFIFGFSFYFFSLLLSAIFFGALLAWKPRKTGPIRLFIAGVALPALTTFIAVLPISRLGG